MVKVKNISKNERKLYINGKWVYIQPKEIIDVSYVPEQKDIFKQIKEEEKKAKPEKKTKKNKKIKEVDNYDSSSN